MNDCKECVCFEMCETKTEENERCFVSAKSIKKPCDVCKKSKLKQVECPGCLKYKMWFKVYWPVLCSIHNGKIIKDRRRNNEIR